MTSIVHASSAALRRWVPAWWRGETGEWSKSLHLPLFPAEGAYRAGVALRNSLYDRELIPTRSAPVPTISVGNLAVGGTGKTPVSAWLASRLREAGHAPAIILRGYGADEVTLHAELNPGVEVIVGARRVEAAAEAARRGCDCIILDDGFQHRQLRRDLDIVLIATESWTKQRRLLPRGPWREPVSALRRADYLLVTRKTASLPAASAIIDALRTLGSVPDAGVAHLISGDLVPLSAASAGSGQPLSSLRGRRVVAITTLADPVPFLAQLRATGASVETMTFADHHDFSEREVELIVDRLATRTAVMTRKEAVKLRSRLPSNCPAFVLEQTVHLEAGAVELNRAIGRALGVTREVTR